MGRHDRARSDHVCALTRFCSAIRRRERTGTERTKHLLHSRSRTAPVFHRSKLRVSGVVELFLIGMQKKIGGGKVGVI